MNVWALQQALWGILAPPLLMLVGLITLPLLINYWRNK